MVLDLLPAVGHRSQRRGNHLDPALDRAWHHRGDPASPTPRYGAGYPICIMARLTACGSAVSEEPKAMTESAARACQAAPHLTRRRVSGSGSCDAQRSHSIARSDSHHVPELRRVDVLLEPCHLAVLDVPDVADLRVHASAGRLVRPAVAGFNNDAVANAVK